MSDKVDSTRLVVGIVPIALLVAGILGFFFITIIGHAERIAKNETNISNIMSIVCETNATVKAIDGDIKVIKARTSK